MEGGTSGRLVERRGLVQRQPQVIENQGLQAAAYAKQAGRREMDRLHSEGFLYRDMWQAMSAVYDEEIDDAKRELRDHFEAFPQLERQMYLQARADVLKAERNAISDASARGFISQEVYEALIVETDRHLAALEQLELDQGNGLAVQRGGEQDTNG